MTNDKTAIAIGDRVRCFSGPAAFYATVQGIRTSPSGRICYLLDGFVSGNNVYFGAEHVDKVEQDARTAAPNAIKTEAKP